MHPRWHIAPDLEDWLQQASHFVRAAETLALARQGAFHLVLAGGGTPRLLYERLACEAHDWARWQIWLGDERCLPAQAAQRNSVMVQESLLAPLPLSVGAFHPIEAELGPEVAARRYGAALAQVDAFDLVLLGLGEDGHTASLFPGQDWGSGPDAPAVLPVRGAPKPPAARVSLSAQRLARARQVLFLVTGAGKREALQRWRNGEPIPAAAIQPAAGVEVLMTADSLPPSG